MKNNFTIAFGVSFLIVALLNVFLEVNECVLFSLTLSALIFSLIDLLELKLQIKSKKIIILLCYIIGLAILVTGMAFSNSLMDIIVINSIINSKISNIISFLSFGLIFIFNYLKEKERIKKMKNEGFKNASAQFELLNSAYAILIDWNKKEKDTNKIKQNLTDYVEDYSLLAQLKSELLKNNKSKSEYTLEEIEDAFKKHSNPIKEFERKKDILSKK